MDYAWHGIYFLQIYRKQILCIAEQKKNVLQIHRIGKSRIRYFKLLFLVFREWRSMGLPLSIISQRCWWSRNLMFCGVVKSICISQRLASGQRFACENQGAEMVPTNSNLLSAMASFAQTLRRVEMDRHLFLVVRQIKLDLLEEFAVGAFELLSP